MKIDIQDVRFRRLVEHLHELGPRALGEFLVGLRAQEKVANNLESYERLTPEALAIVGGDQWPSRPLHTVER